MEKFDKYRNEVLKFEITIRIDGNGFHYNDISEHSPIGYNTDWYSKHLEKLLRDAMNDLETLPISDLQRKKEMFTFYLNKITEIYSSLPKLSNDNIRIFENTLPPPFYIENKLADNIPANMHDIIKTMTINCSETFIHYLPSYIADKEDTITNFIKLLSGIIENTNLPENIKNTSSTKEKKPLNPNLHLKDILDKQTYWTYLKSELAEKNIVNINSGLSTNKVGRSFFASLVKHLHSLGYYKENKMPTHEEIRTILKNTFAVELKIDAVKRAKVNFIDPAIKKIKYPSEITNTQNT